MADIYRFTIDFVLIANADYHMVLVTALIVASIGDHYMNIVTTATFVNLVDADRDELADQLRDQLIRSCPSSQVQVLSSDPSAQSGGDIVRVLTDPLFLTALLTGFVTFTLVLGNFKGSLKLKFGWSGAAVEMELEPSSDGRIKAVCGNDEIIIDKTDDREIAQWTRKTVLSKVEK